MPAYNEPRDLEKYILHGVLIAGGLIFSFPFMWMVGTSMKVQREMSVEELEIAPDTPRPQVISPWIDERQFKITKSPDGMPREVWNQALPELEEKIKEKIAGWQPRTPGAYGLSPGARNLEHYSGEMLQGVMKTLAARISDEARKAAFVAERKRNPRVEQSGPFSEASIEVGAEAVVRDGVRLADDELLSNTFDQMYRRFCLAGMRFRTTSRQVSTEPGKEWSVQEGDVKLFKRTERSTTFQEVHYDFTKSASARFVFPNENMPEFKEEVERIYLSFRGDSSWANAAVYVTFKGDLYMTENSIELYEREWQELQLRWPWQESDSMEPQTWNTLQKIGAAPAGSGFSVMMEVVRNTKPGAWKDKILRNYYLVFREVPFLRYILTSVALSILNIVLAIFSCTLAAYAFARLQWPGRNLCFALMLATMMIPGQVTMIPGFLIHKHLGWYNTLLPLWVHSAFGSAFFIFLLRQFFKTIPQDLEDAARIDGCGFFRIYWHVMMPLVKPTIATIAIFTFMGVWNNFMGPLIYLNDERLFPLAIGLFKFSLRSGGDVGLMMAGSFLMTLPIIVLFFFAQRYFIQGISLTGMKG
ncbi:MAG: carbohydrate ABC transporter permease [Planctomycetota bacterium]|nr:carbohydrate ABC transporter permease [Planctomycetota bacterium]MDA1141371.1 carbohydrate ABC transporter permease [Planctomycetota bacterium]